MFDYHLFEPVIYDVHIHDEQLTCLTLYCPYRQSEPANCVKYLVEQISV